MNGPSRRRISEIAEKLGVSVDFLLSEDLSSPVNAPNIISDADLKGSGLSNVPQGKLRWVPVVSFARAGQDGFDYEDLGSHFDEWAPTASTDANAFALRVEGDSMERKYSAGDILVVNPNEEPRNGDLVVARLEKSGGVLFKLYHQVGPNRIRLTSYNLELYPPLEFNREEFRFIYPIVNVLGSPRGR